MFLLRNCRARIMIFHKDTEKCVQYNNIIHLRGKYNYYKLNSKLIIIHIGTHEYYTNRKLIEIR